MNLPNQFRDLIIHVEMINQFYWVITTITLSCHHSWITNAPVDPFILTIEDPPAEYLFQNRFRNAYTSGGHLQAVGAVENDYDPRITIRLHTRRGKMPARWLTRKWMAKKNGSDHVSSGAHVYRPRTVKFTPSHFRNEWPGSCINGCNILFYISSPSSLRAIVKY